VNRSHARFALGVVIILVGAGFVGSLLFFKVPEGNERILDLAAGIMLGWGGAVVSFYFGSSSGSTAKDEAISGLASMGERLVK
jgi:hypothetical protein